MSPTHFVSVCSLVFERNILPGGVPPNDREAEITDVWLSRQSEALIDQYNLYPLADAKYEVWDRGGGNYNYIIAGRNGKTNCLVKYDTNEF